MKKIVAIGAIVAVVASAGINTVFAQESILNAKEVITKAQLNILSPERGLGSPDGSYADFLDEEAYVLYELNGSTSEDLTLHIVIRDIGASVRVAFLDDQLVELASGSSVFPIGATQVTIPYQGEGEYSYVKITSAEEEEWRLDALEASDAAGSEVEEDDGDLDGDGVITDEEQDVESRIPYGNEQGTAGTLVKSGNSSSVYLIGEDGMRHAFPIGGIFTSWGYSFDDVVTISEQQIATYQLGKNVTVRPGTWLVKIQTDPKTYAVEPGGVLRWVQTEAHARELFGDDWNKKIFDVSDAFWKNYTLGEPLNAGEVPSGMWVTDSLATFVTKESGARRLSPAEEQALRVSEQFVIDQTITTEVSRPLDDSDLSDDIHPF